MLILPTHPKAGAVFFKIRLRSYNTWPDHFSPPEGSLPRVLFLLFETGPLYVTHTSLYSNSQQSSCLRFWSAGVTEVYTISSFLLSLWDWVVFQPDPSFAWHVFLLPALGFSWLPSLPHFFLFLGLSCFLDILQSFSGVAQRGADDAVECHV